MKILEIFEKSNQNNTRGNGLLSKRPDRFLPNGWPIYYSKAKGSIFGI